VGKEGRLSLYGTNRRSGRGARQNVAMQFLRALARHHVAGPLLRYCTAGATVAAVYLSIPIVLGAALDVPIQVAIPVAYIVAVSLHFTLQRHFVFGHVTSFALTAREQIARYVAIGAVQYPTTALASAFFPGLLGVSEPVVFVCTTLVVSTTFFLLLRSHVFHPTEEPDAPHPLDGAVRSLALVPMRRSERRSGQGD
jgi:putative flippase GtrA